MHAYVKTRPKTVINVSRIVTIHYYEFGPNFIFAGEQHDFWEMVYVDKGTVQIRRDDEDVVLQQGEVIFHRPNEFHAIRSLNSAPNFFVISFTCTSEAMCCFEKYQTKLDKTLKAYLSSIIREAESTYRIPKNDPELTKLERRENALLGGEQLIQMYLQQLLIFMLRAMNDHADAIFPQKEPQLHPLVRVIQAYLESKVEETVRIEDLCYEFGYSRSFLSRLFQEETGASLAAYAMQRKIDKAKALIRETKLNFAQISARLGFENPQYFSRVFKRCTGMTPTEFKNRAHI